MSKWLTFKLQPRTRLAKTDKWDVINTETRFLLGEIKWYGAFRQYSFFPTANTVFEKTCLQDITDFLKEQMEKRKTLTPDGNS